MLGGPGHLPIDRVGDIIIDLTNTLSSKDLVVVGEVAGNLDMRLLERARIHRSPPTDFPDVAEIARLGVHRYQSRGPDDLTLLEPIYIRPPDVTLPRSR
jgi:hypothetical protein